MNDSTPARLVRAVAVSGSPSRESRSRRLLAHAVGRFAAAGAETRILNLCDVPADDLLGRARSSTIAAALSEVDAAHVLIVGTPVYRAAYSGLLKVFFDLMTPDALAHGGGPRRDRCGPGISWCWTTRSSRCSRARRDRRLDRSLRHRCAVRRGWSGPDAHRARREMPWRRRWCWRIPVVAGRAAGQLHIPRGNLRHVPAGSRARHLLRTPRLVSSAVRRARSTPRSIPAATRG